MGLFDDAVPGGKIGKPLLIALGALLVSKMLGGRRDQSDPANPKLRRPVPRMAAFLAALVA